MSIDITSFMLGPSLVGIVLLLNYIGFPYLFIGAVSGIVCLVFAYREKLSLELVINLLTSLIAHVFFRELDSRNTHSIPESGPVIFVCAPHANQFLDPAVMQQFVPRPVSFLIAAKSYRDRIVGTFARAQRSIPVERPQDLAKPVAGRITVAGRTATAASPDTPDFTTVFGPTDSLMVAGEIVAIAAVTPTVLTLKAEHPTGDIASPAPFKRVPKVRQDDVFGNVWDRLAAGDCVGIFPEGGSHDRTELLPLKAGVAIMALGAAAKYPGLDVKIVCVGMNYFHGHRFRGRAYVEYGDPFSLPSALVAQYRNGGAAKIEACNQLLEIIKDSLKSVTVSAPSWAHLQMLWAVRRLYQPEGVRLPPKLAVILIRRFAEAYEQVKDDAEVVEVAGQVMAYNALLKTYGLRDHQVALTENSRARAALKLLWRGFRALLIVLLAVPGLVLNLPIIVLTRSIANKKAGEALKTSTVKVQAKDVLASWKVITSLSLVPLTLVVYPILSALAGYWLGYSPLVTWGNFAVLQPVMMWAGVRATETGMHIIRSLKPLFLAVTDASGGELAAVRAVREQLRLRVRKLVDDLGPRIYGAEFQSLRLFSPEVFRKTAAAAARLRAGGAGAGARSRSGSSSAKHPALPAADAEQSPGGGDGDADVFRLAREQADEMAVLSPRLPASASGPQRLTVYDSRRESLAGPHDADVATATAAAAASGAPASASEGSLRTGSADAAATSAAHSTGEALGARTVRHGHGHTPGSGRATPALSVCDSEPSSEISITDDGVVNLRLDPAVLARLTTGLIVPEDLRETLDAAALAPLPLTESDDLPDAAAAAAAAPAPRAAPTAATPVKRSAGAVAGSPFTSAGKSAVARALALAAGAGAPVAALGDRKEEEEEEEEDHGPAARDAAEEAAAMRQRARAATAGPE
jgi:glycerol-3-phosphate O-acyltransferase/dihydroxyacetone phosphate acyltransferase